ncbi:UAA transporter family-domain-containing protein [Lentinula aciculospora]|uniref:UDP-galactose transporter homolog 1 n=1 Tax=Lentinula aciculospora TaxID=153920 RepID=A0A9W9AHI2_9AGAR|nr:UAA transporter family-domain-containing protein [Lentinula aciculospora]
MSFIRLVFCVAGVYSMFLWWAIAQERLSVPFQSVDGKSSDKFRSALFLGTCQSFLSSFSALIYILIRKKRPETFMQALGFHDRNSEEPTSASTPNGKAHTRIHHHTNGTAKPRPDTRFSSRALLLGYAQCAAFITFAAPFGFAALSYISYPAMVLGKSCKLVPVMIMNVFLYRRRFAPHKYLVVLMVTTGITIFMGFGSDSQKHGSKKAASASMDAASTPYASLIGAAYLLINLALDGAINSTQDEMFSRYKVSGQQMMLWINLMCTCISFTLMVLPLPSIPVLLPSGNGRSELVAAWTYIQQHPGIISPLVEFSVTGALGQLFIFETLQHFGSLTLVTITLTRKMFTMLLSVVVYNHQLTPNQWLGAAVVFAGISVEAFVKRNDIHAKRVLQEKEKAKLKSL